MKANRENFVEEYIFREEGLEYVIPRNIRVDWEILNEVRESLDADNQMSLLFFECVCYGDIYLLHKLGEFKRKRDLEDDEEKKHTIDLKVCLIEKILDARIANKSHRDEPKMEKKKDIEKHPLYHTAAAFVTLEEEIKMHNKNKKNEEENERK
jgi:hypothetical protein